ncbi:AMP-binding protein [Thiomicrorhabdus sediminis]|uniref:Acyl-[ACP]--phospholipid O-acyltransferase n=1 Tax=Thiomicrorhabdus sediminis TaxID=2580412 RepID=A0A4P9K2U7_9GAMM|nr:AMP-binding protein [Thiomicrorhabdus sediminis]QCU89174.1 acyl-[ACP]--phospholipid O-acyltransferase [Thiomicrorhabdus sediminis]
MKSLLKLFVKGLFKLCYRVEVKGLENYQAAEKSGRPLLIIANHVSLLDGPLLDLFIPGNTAFMVDKSHTQKWFERFILSMSEYFTVDTHSPYAAKHMIEELNKGKQCMIFPEGRISTTGALMKVYEGTGLVADKTQAAVLSVHIGGAELSRLSYLDGTKSGFIKQQWFPKITISIQPHTQISHPQNLKGTEKHKFYKQAVFKLLRDSSFFAAETNHSLYAALIKAKQKYHSKDVCIEDINGQNLSLKKLTLASIILGRALKKTLKKEKRVGLMLPNVSGMPATFFALQAYGYVPAMINFTAGKAAIESACVTAELQTIVTSRRFIEAFEIEALVESLEDKVRFVYLEDIRSEIGIWQKISGLLTPAKSLPGYKTETHFEAVVLFTSGSEGAPKGVVLSHNNVTSNIEQAISMLNLIPTEKVFNALPTFHCFGLTAGLLLPVLKGAKTFMYPSPVHYAVVPEMVYQSNAKYIFGTDTFYSGYARKADSYDFFNLRMMIAGAERLRPETRELYANKYHQPIYEGYGVTETTPILAVNIPTAYKHGSVGQFVPGIEYHLEEVPGIKDAGRLLVKGPNVMLGYLMPGEPGVLQPPTDGWHDTGDIVQVDEEGYVWIKGRAKRFAKIGGEMVSLTAVERYINKASPEGHHVVVAVPDERKGEKLVLVTDDEGLSRKTVSDAARLAEVAELMIPKTVILVESIPVLGTGKTNYPEVQKLAEQHSGGS